MKKLFTLLVAFILSLTMMTSVSAIGLTPIEDESKLYIETATVPSNVTSYAADIFMHMGKPVWANFGISDSQLSNLTLSQGFRMISVNTMQYSDIAYYFLIYAGDSVVAIMTISNVNGELGYQIERNLLAVDISEKLKSSAQPYKIYVSDNAYYFIQNNQIIHVSSEEYLYDKDRIVDDCMVISNSIARSTDNVIDATITNISEPAASCSFSDSIDSDYYSNSCFVLHVDNDKFDSIITDSDGNQTIEPQGVCWAACTASVCDFYKRGCVNWNSQNDFILAEQLRDDIIKERRQTNNGDLSTSVAETAPFINERLPSYGYGFLNYSYRHSKLPSGWVMLSISDKQPSITGWFYYDSVKDKKYGHAMVLDGYYYLINDPSPDQHFSVYFMNPNTKPMVTPQGDKWYNNVLVGYDNCYIIQGNPYTWEDTTCSDSYI